MIKTTAQKIYLGLIFIFLYAPIVTLIVLSFNASKTRAKWGGFTTKWYRCPVPERTDHAGSVEYTGAALCCLH